ncbi:MAG: HDOD domain-containing protein [Verrucomicrobia bacterium]|nr:HDOD domain-containing protein [Verrucomicrobiota bacterium]
MPLARVLQVADGLPSAPRILAELQVLLNDTNNGLDEITVLLRRDAGLTARVIRIANGIVYNKGDPVASLEEALGRIGFNEVYRLAGIAAVAQLAAFELRHYPFRIQRMRENSLFVALAAEELAPLAQLDARAAFTAGLMRSAGRLAIDVTVQRDQPYFRALPLDPAGRLGEWETANFGLGGGEVSEALLRKWKFPYQVYVPIRDQYLRGLSVDPLPEAKILNVAAGIADAAGIGLPGEAGYWSEGADERLQSFDIDAALLADLSARVQARFEKMRATLA